MYTVLREVNTVIKDRYRAIWCITFGKLTLTV